MTIANNITCLRMAINDEAVSTSHHVPPVNRLELLGAL